jgi:methanogenic corrinoid protein MtbC1
MESLPQEQSSRGGSSRSAASLPCQDDLPEFRPALAANDMRMSQLARTIEQEIIPRLMLAHRPAAETVAKSPEFNEEIAADEVPRFAKLVLSQDEDAAFAAVQGLRARGVPVDKIYVDLLGRTARYLGELWDDDLCSFSDVTVGLGRLQRVLRELSPALGHSVAHPSQGRRVLLLPSPGEQHTFGLVMVAEFFRRAGWDVTGGAWGATADPAELVRNEWFDALGFSLGAESHLAQLKASIAAVRHATCNRHVAILVGGPLFGLHPEFVGMVGADGMTLDGREAPSLAEGLIAARSPQQVILG